MPSCYWCARRSDKILKEEGGKNSGEPEILQDSTIITNNLLAEDPSTSPLLEQGITVYLGGGESSIPSTAETWAVLVGVPCAA